MFILVTIEAWMNDDSKANSLGADVKVLFESQPPDLKKQKQILQYLSSWFLAICFVHVVKVKRDVLINAAVDCQQHLRE